LPFEVAGGDDVAAELVGAAAVEGLAVFDAPQPATDSAAAPVSVMIAKRVSREGEEVVDIESPFRSSASRRGQATQHFSRLVALLRTGWRSTMSQLCIRGSRV
jgi:hypothetical protein